MTRRALAFSSLLLTLLWVASSAVAEPDPPSWCFDANANGELPTCTWDGTSWTRSYDSPMTGGGMPGGFVLLFVLVVAAGIAITVWRVTTARQLARKAGMDPGQATAMSLLEDNGLEATYLAANLRDRSTGTAAGPTTRSTEDRLRELERLRDQGLVTSEEYDNRRRAILDSL
jgi:hypothetical protein